MNRSRRSRAASDHAFVSRGQANLAALSTALFVLAAVTVVALAIANGAFAGETRPVGERHAATAVADRLVSADSPLTNRTNVLNATAIQTVTAADLRRHYPVVDGRAIRVSLDEKVLAADGDPSGGTTLRRIVLVERTSRRTFKPSFTAGNRIALPRRTSRARLDITPPENVSVRAVRANDRTALRNADGLRGIHRVSVNRHETVRFTFIANGSLSRGNVEVTTYPRDTAKAELAVTVDE